MTFKTGDQVTWTSQAAGSSKTKTGEVVEVVAKGSRPNRDMFLSLYRSNGVGFSRNHESYVVMVKNKKFGVKFYWPMVKNLRSVATGA
jgi:hypothetical protein